MNKRDLEERLIGFAVSIVGDRRINAQYKGWNNLGPQLLRSGTSPALNYGEAKVESREGTLFIRSKLYLRS